MNFFKKLFDFSQKPSTPSEDSVGRDGEKIAAEFLNKLGHRIVDRNWRCKIGELDIITIKNNCYYFVEVKSSLREGIVLPEDRVNYRKQNKLRQLANFYVKHHKIDKEFQFAVIAVFWKDEKPQVRFIENAF